VTRIAHISDTHFGMEDVPVCAALVNDLLREAPDLIVLTGDITQRARRAEFRAAGAFLCSLAPIPILALPGNHDLPLFDLLTRFIKPYRYYKQYIDPVLAPLWQGDEVAVLGVNSTRVLRHKHGFLPANIVQSVAQRLAELPQPFKVVALHHPLAVITSDDRNNRVRAAEEALDAWISAGADLFLGGHIHLPYCIPASATSRQVVILQAGTAVSTRRRSGQPNSFNLVCFEMNGGRRMLIEQRDYDLSAGIFVSRRVWKATSSADGWVLFPDSRERSV